MNFIWDIIINAKDNDIKKDELFFVLGKDISPWYEQSFSCLNQTNVDSNFIEINPFYRFNHIFQDFLHVDFDENLEFRKYFFDLVVHFLAEIDLSLGTNQNSVFLNVIEQEINTSVLGEDLALKFKQFFGDERVSMLMLVLTQLNIGSSMMNFKKAIKISFKNCLLYQIKDETDNFILYTSAKENEVNQDKLDFITEMFLPLGCNLRVFWTEHFGLLGIEQSMKLDTIELF